MSRGSGCLAVEEAVLTQYVPILYGLQIYFLLFFLFFSIFISIISIYFVSKSRI